MKILKKNMKNNFVHSVHESISNRIAPDICYSLESFPNQTSPRRIAPDFCYSVESISNRIAGPRFIFVHSNQFQIE